MTATTLETNTRVRLGDDEVYPLAASASALKGTLAVLNGGYVQQAVTALNLVAVGMFLQSDSNAGGAAGAVSTPVRRGKIELQNSTGADLITQANVGSDCYIVDNQTVAATSGTGTRSRAGKVCAIDPSGTVWVQVGLGW